MIAHSLKRICCNWAILGAENVAKSIISAQVSQTNTMYLLLLFVTKKISIPKRQLVKEVCKIIILEFISNEFLFNKKVVAQDVCSF